MNDKKRATKNINTAKDMCRSVALLHAALKEGNQRAIVISSTVLGTFGIETALKALILREGKNPGNIHNLRKLYDKLAPETQQRICEKGAAIDIRVNGKGMRIRVEGVIDEHQESFQEWRYREAGKDLPVVLSVLPGTLQALIQTHDEKYGEDIKREKKQETDQAPSAMSERGMEYRKKVLIQKSGR